VLAKSAKRTTGKGLARACILLGIALCHAVLIGLMVHLTAQRMQVVPAGIITFLSMPPPPARPPPPAASDATHDSSAAATPIPPTPMPNQNRPRQQVRAALTGQAAPHDPCAPPATNDRTQPRDPACDPQAGNGRPVQLNLPGGFHQDDGGAIVPNQASLFALLPPDTPERIQQDAARHYAALIDVFGPPYPALNFNDPYEKGPLIQFVEDRLAKAPLTPQTTLREQGPAPLGAN